MDDPYLMGRVHLLEDSLPAADKEEEYKVTVELIHERLLGLLDRLAPNAPNGFRDTIRGLKNPCLYRSSGRLTPSAQYGGSSEAPRDG